MTSRLKQLIRSPRLRLWYIAAVVLLLVVCPLAYYVHYVLTDKYKPQSWLSWFRRDLRGTELFVQKVERQIQNLGPPVISQTTTEIGYQHPPLKKPPATEPWVQLDLGEPQDFDWIALVPAIVGMQPGAEPAPYGFPTRFRVDVSNDPEFRESTSIATYVQKLSNQHGLLPTVFETTDKGKARYIRITVNKLARENDRYFFALSELMVIQGAHNIALKSKITASDSANLPPRWNLSNLIDGRAPIGPPIRRELSTYDGLFASQLGKDSPAWIKLDLRKSQPLTEIRLHPVHARQGADVPGFAFPLRFVVEVSDDPDFKNSHILLNSKDTPFSNPGNNPVTIPAHGHSARFMRVLMHEASVDKKNSFGLSEIEIYSDKKNIARGSKVSFTPDLSDPMEKRTPLIVVDGYTSYGKILSLAGWMQYWRNQHNTRVRLRELVARREFQSGLARQRALIVGMSLGFILISGTLYLLIRERRKRVEAVEKLRNRLAQDLHDEIGSNIAGIAIISETAANQSPNAVQKKDWLEVNKIALETTSAMREVLWLVGARAEAGPDFIALLQRTASRLLPGHSVTWKSLPEHVPVNWDGNARRQVFLFFKEALTNITRHARAKHVDLSLDLDDRGITLSIHDDGKGFCSKTEFVGMGLQSMKARAKNLKGSMVLESEPERGTLVQLLVPLTVSAVPLAG